MRRIPPTSTLLLISLCFACTPAPAADDEAGVTTVMGGESDASASTTGSGTDPSTLPGTETAPPDDSATFFVPPLDQPMWSECDVFEQDCPVGEKCVPFASSRGWYNDFKCVPILGDQAAGEPCTYAGMVEATDDCDATSICWEVLEVDGELVGTCTPQCTGSPDAPLCPPDLRCQLFGQEGPWICIQDCDPLAQDCNEGLGCYWANSTFECIFTTENIPTGAPCGYINDCAPGNLCADATALPSCAGSACCTQYCNLPDGDAGCVEQPGTACVPFFEQGMAPPMYEHVGICILPGA